MSFQPLHNRVLVRRTEAASYTKGGLVLPEQAQDKPQTAVVVAAGAGRLLNNGTVLPLAVKAGDTVLLGKYSGETLKLDGVEHVIIKEEDILAVLS